MELPSAALNRAYSHGKAKSPEPPFRNVDAAKIQPLDVRTVLLAIRKADPEFRPVLEGVTATGAQYGELIVMRVGDYQRCSVSPRNGCERGWLATMN